MGAQQGRASDPYVNFVVLQGEVIEGWLEPESEEVAVIAISFPDGGEFWASESLPPASCEIAVPAPVARRFGKSLRVGDDLHVVGMVSDEGRIVAWLIGREPPFERP